MDLYDVPRPVNQCDGKPKYMNVSRSAEEELEYIAFSERREREQGKRDTSHSVVQEPSQREEEAKRKGKSKGTCCLVLLELLTLIVALVALVLGTLSFVGLGNVSRTTSGTNTPVLISALLATPCFSNSTMCSNSGGSDSEECVVTYSPAPNINVRISASVLSVSSYT